MTSDRPDRRRGGGPGGPADRHGSFEPQIVRKGQTRLAGFNERIIALYNARDEYPGYDRWLRVWDIMGAGYLGGPAQASLHGRRSECAACDALVAAVRQGESRVLVVRGEAGIGKSELLAYLVGAASDLTVVQAIGVESEMELAFASLHQFCAPMLDCLERLPAPQREALKIVFGLTRVPRLIDSSSGWRY